MTGEAPAGRGAPERRAAEALDAFVQAGGRSTRMGVNKALLELGGRTLVERVVDAARPVAARVVLVANDPEPYRGLGLEVVPDRFPGAAALGGIATALHASRTGRALVLACDLPFVTAALLGYLAGIDPEAEVTVPETAGEGLHPLCAVYATSCLPWIERRIAAGRLKVAGFYPDVRVRVVGEAELRARGFGPELLANLNRPEEYRAARTRLDG